MFIEETKNIVLSFINNISEGDSTVKGFVMLWLLASASWFIRNFPNKILKFIKHHSLTSITINKDTDIKNIEFFNNVENWFLTNNKFSIRNTKINYDAFGSITGLGYGSHIAFCKGRIYWIEKTFIERQGTNHFLETMNIVTIGRLNKVFEKVIQDSQVRDDINYIYSMDDIYGRNSLWVRTSIFKKSSKLFIDENIKKKIDDAVLFFKDNKDWYIKNNFPYKLTILLYGPPGTGKTSLINYITQLLNADLYDVNLNLIHKNNLNKMKQTERQNISNVLCLEDFEGAALKRQTIAILNSINNKADGVELTEEEQKYQGINRYNINLKDILNALQGVEPLDNVVVVLTTNHLEMVDPALYRNGRVDLLLEVGPIGIKEVSDYYEFYYSQPFPSHIDKIKPIKACDMEALFKNNIYNPERFISQLVENYVE